MTPSQPPPPPEKLLERVLRVAGLLTVPAEQIHTEKQQSGNPTDSMIPAVDMESDDTAKPVKRHFPVK
jgi:hypothetical protein